ncbi:MAG: hypothetical protein ACK528_11675 [Alphaproteobacteria bacterium]|jgi:hypothetical protein
MTTISAKSVQVAEITEKILMAKDKVVNYTYLDFGNCDERVSVIEYSSEIVGSTLQRTFNYTLVSGKYRLDEEVWEVF